MASDSPIARYRDALARISMITAGLPEDLESLFHVLTVEAAVALGVDRVGIWFLADEGQTLHCVDQYVAASGEHEAGARLSRDDNVPYFEALEHVRTIAAEDAWTDPRTCGFGEAYLRGLDVRSMLDIPIVSRGRSIGVVCHEVVGRRRAWSDSDELFAGSIGDMASIGWVAARRHEAETALHEERQRLQLALEAAQMGTWSWNLDADEVLWSSEAVGVFGRPLHWRPANREGFLSLLPAEDRRAVEAEILRASLHPAERFLVQHRVIMADGRLRWVEAQGRIALTRDGQRVLAGTVRDLTQQKALQESLRHAHKMEALGRLAGGVAHDFNNLLTVMMGSLSMLEDHVQTSQGARLLDMLSASTDRAAALTDQLLSFARKRRERTDVIDVRQQVLGLEALYSRLVPECVGVELDLHGEAALPVRMDPVQLDQVLLNLVVNASEAIEGTGTVRVRVERCEDAVLLSVEDDGQGIDAAIRERLFEPFFTTKDTGTGLGLATSLGIVEQAGGTISVSDRQGGGSRFEVRLPLSGERVRSTPVAPDRAPVASAARVLVVEDEPSVAELVRRMLEGAGLRVEVAIDVATGIAAVERGPDIDLLVTDVVLPDGLGTTVADRVLQTLPEARVLLMSGYAPVDLPLSERVHFLAKPFTAKSLLQRIEGLTSGR